MRRPSARPQSTFPNQSPPFDAPAARRLRVALGMGPEHVAHDLRASYGLPHVTPDLVVAWEDGTTAPSGPELTSLAYVLWCSPGELMARPRTLREHRIAGGLAPEDVARFVGLELHTYLRMEATGEWRGTDRQAAALARVLGLALRDLLAVTGRDARLAELLRSAVTTRWQPYVRPLAKIAPLDRRLLEATLRELHQEYAAGRDFLDRIVEHFWARVQDSTG